MAHEVTLLLQEIGRGGNDGRVALDNLLPIVYDELRRLAGVSCSASTRFRCKLPNWSMRLTSSLRTSERLTGRIADSSLQSLRKRCDGY
jgi:hypothetical protein